MRPFTVPINSGITYRTLPESHTGFVGIRSRRIVLTRYTEPEPEMRLLLARLRLDLPTQPPQK